MSDLKLVVKPTVTAGIERGGEDLDFYIEASFPGSTPPKSINGLAKEWDFGNGGFNHETRTATGKVHISTYYDEFEWEGDLDDVGGDADLACGDEHVGAEGLGGLLARGGAQADRGEQGGVAEAAGELRDEREELGYP